MSWANKLMASRHGASLALLGALVVGLRLTLGGAPSGVYGLGLVAGVGFALHAVAVILVFRSSRLISFAQVAFGAVAGQLFALSARYAPIPRWLHLCDERCAGGGIRTFNYWMSAVLAVAIAAVLGWVIYHLAIRRFADAPRMVLTIATVFAATTVSVMAGFLPLFMVTRRQFVDQVLSGPASPGAKLPFAVSLRFGGVLFHSGQIATVVLGLAAIAGVQVYLRMSATGTAVRAASEEPARAETLGINVPAVTGRIWAIAAALSALAGILDAMVSGGGVPGATTAAGSVLSAGAAGLFVAVLAAAVLARMQSIGIGVLAAVALGVGQQAVVFAKSEASLFNGSLVFVLTLALLLQRERRSRLDEATGSWRAVSEPRPTPPELIDVPSVRRAYRAVAVGGAAVLLGLPWMLDARQNSILTQAVVLSLVALSLMVLAGWTAQVSLGQFAISGIAAYTAAWLHIPFPVALVVGAITGCATAVMLGIPALRLRGMHLAVTSLSLAVFVSEILLSHDHLGKYTRDLHRPTYLGLNLESGPTYYYVCLAVLAGAILALQGLRRSRTARALLAARDNDLAAQSFGINLLRARLTGFAVAGMLAGIAGVLYGYLQHGVSSLAFGADLSASVFVNSVAGGLSSATGAVIGQVYAALALLLPLSALTRGILTGPIELALVLMFPGGIASILFRVRDSFLRRVALREGLLVPSLLADERASRRRSRAALQPLEDFVPQRYEVGDQWAISAAAGATSERLARRARGVAATSTAGVARV